MKMFEPTDRVIVIFRAEKKESANSYDIQQTLPLIGNKIYNGYSTGHEKVNGYEVAWEYECEEYGGFRHGIVKQDTMQDIKNLLETYDSCDALDLEDTIAFRDDAIELLHRIVKENLE